VELLHFVEAVRALDQLDEVLVVGGVGEGALEEFGGRFFLG